MRVSRSLTHRSLLRFFCARHQTMHTAAPRTINAFALPTSLLFLFLFRPRVRLTHAGERAAAAAGGPLRSAHDVGVVIAINPESRAVRVRSAADTNGPGWWYPGAVDGSAGPSGTIQAADPLPAKTIQALISLSPAGAAVAENAAGLRPLDLAATNDGAGAEAIAVLLAAAPAGALSPKVEEVAEAPAAEAVAEAVAPPPEGAEPAADGAPAADSDTQTEGAQPPQPAPAKHMRDALLVTAAKHSGADTVRAVSAADPSAAGTRAAHDGRLPLHWAADGSLTGHRSAEVVAALLKSHPDGARARDSAADETPLHVAARTGAGVEVVRELLSADPSVAAAPAGPSGRLPIHLACTWEGGSPLADAAATIAALLEAHPSGATARDANGDTPLALLLRRPEGVKPTVGHLALQLLAACPGAAEVADSEGRLPLHHALECSAAPAVAAALLKAFPAAARAPSGPHAQPALFRAIALGASPLVILACLRAAPDVAMRRHRGNLPFHAALLAHQPAEVVTAILAANPDAAAARFGAPADDDAAAAAAAAVGADGGVDGENEAKEAEASDADAAATADAADAAETEPSPPPPPPSAAAELTYPLHFAAASGEAWLVALLLRTHPGGVALQDESGYTPLHYALRPRVAGLVPGERVEIADGGSSRGADGAATAAAGVILGTDPSSAKPFLLGEILPRGAEGTSAWVPAGAVRSVQAVPRGDRRLVQALLRAKGGKAAAAVADMEGRLAAHCAAELAPRENPENSSEEAEEEESEQQTRAQVAAAAVAAEVAEERRASILRSGSAGASGPDSSVPFSTWAAASVAPVKPGVVGSGALTVRRLTVYSGGGAVVGFRVEGVFRPTAGFGGGPTKGAEEEGLRVDSGALVSDSGSPSQPLFAESLEMRDGEEVERISVRSDRGRVIGIAVVLSSGRVAAFGRGQGGAEATLCPSRGSHFVGFFGTRSSGAGEGQLGPLGSVGLLCQRTPGAAGAAGAEAADDDEAEREPLSAEASEEAAAEAAFAEAEATANAEAAEAAAVVAAADAAAAAEAAAEAQKAAEEKAQAEARWKEAAAAVAAVAAPSSETLDAWMALLAGHAVPAVAAAPAQPPEPAAPPPPGPPETIIEEEEEELLISEEEYTPEQIAAAAAAGAGASVRAVRRKKAEVAAADALVMWRALLAANPAATSTGDLRGDLPLHVAVRRSCTQAVLAVLLESNPTAAGTPNADGHTPLHVALRLRAPEVVVTAMLSAHPNAARVREGGAEGSGDLPLHLAARLRAPLGVINALLSAFPDGAAEANAAGRCALHVALAAGAAPEVTAALIQACPGAAMRADAGGSVPLHLACSHAASDDVFNELLALAPAAAALADASGRTPLHAALLKRAPAARLHALIEACPQAASARDSGGDLPLHLGLLCCAAAEALSALLAAHPEAAAVQNNAGRTPLLMALPKSTGFSVGEMCAEHTHAAPAHSISFFALIRSFVTPVD